MARGLAATSGQEPAQIGANELRERPGHLLLAGHARFSPNLRAPSLSRRIRAAGQHKEEVLLFGIQPFGTKLARKQPAGPVAALRAATSFIAPSGHLLPPEPRGNNNRQRQQQQQCRVAFPVRSRDSRLEFAPAALEQPSEPTATCCVRPRRARTVRGEAASGGNKGPSESARALRN